MWKLCNSPENTRDRTFYAAASGTGKTDYSHEGSVGKSVRTGVLSDFSTSPKRLLLLLVL